MAALEKTSLTTPVALGRVLGAKRKFTDGAKVKDVQKKKRAKNVNDSRSYKFSYSSYIFNSVKHTFFLSCLVSSGISCVCQVIDTTNLLSILVSINLKSAEISGFHSYHKFHHLYCNFTNSQKKTLNHSPKFPKFPKEKCEVSAVWQAGIRSKVHDSEDKA